MFHYTDMSTGKSGLILCQNYFLCNKWRIPLFASVKWLLQVLQMKPICCENTMILTTSNLCTIFCGLWCIYDHKATPSHTLVSGHPPACKSKSPIYEDYYFQGSYNTAYLLIGAQAEILRETEQSGMLITEQSCIQLLPLLFSFYLA